MIKKITIDKEKCVHCGMCLKDCPVNILEFDEDKYPKYCSDCDTACIECQHCMMVCPTGALSFSNKNPNDSIKSSSIDSEELLNFIKSRRSVRFYKDENVPKDKLDKIIEMIPYPPTGGNRDNLHFTIIETKEKMAQIRKATYDNILASNSNHPTFSAARNAIEKGNDVVYRNATSMIAVAIDKSNTVPGCETADAIIALSYLELYAQSLGLGTVWCDYAVTLANLIPEVHSLLEIPENYSLDYILILGVPNINYPRVPQKERFSIKLLK